MLDTHQREMEVEENTIADGKRASSRTFSQPEYSYIEHRLHLLNRLHIQKCSILILITINRHHRHRHHHHHHPFHYN
jgi:hypothetical protein